MAADAASMPAFTEAQLAEAQRLMDEVPRIDAALKTYLSLRMAQAMAPGADGSAPAPASQTMALQGCARILLKALNALELPPSTAWSQAHPQREDETGMDFMGRIGMYRILQALWERSRKAEQKPAKLLGRSALVFLLPEVMPKLLADAPASARSLGLEEEQFRAFLEGFAATVGTAEAAPDTEDARLVWAASVRAALGARNSQRQAEAAERLAKEEAEAPERAARASSAEAFTQQLRDMVAGATAASSSSGGPVIEELPDEDQK